MRTKGSKPDAKRKRRPRLRLMYYLLDRIKVPQRWDLEGTVRAVAAREWAGNMRRAFKRRLARGRRRR